MPALTRVRVGRRCALHRRRLPAAGLALLFLPQPAPGQEHGADPIVLDGYFQAVAEFFDVPRAEIDILHDWNLPPDEIPVALFVAERAGVSAEAAVAIWREGVDWSGILERYGIGVESLHLPLPQGTAAGALARVYSELERTPVKDWEEVELTADEVVAFVNLRLIAGVSGGEFEEALLLSAGDMSFVEIYAILLGLG